MNEQNNDRQKFLEAYEQLSEHLFGNPSAEEIRGIHNWILEHEHCPFADMAMRTLFDTIVQSNLEPNAATYRSLEQVKRKIRQQEAEKRKIAADLRNYLLAANKNDRTQ